VRNQRENGVALITALFVLILVTALAVGMCWMVMTDQRLGGNNQFRETAFYGAEAGMEKLTADVGTTFANQGSLSTADMTTLTAVANQPTITGIQFLDANGNSTYQILCGNPLASPCVPVSNNATMLPPSPYAGMQGLITPFTLSVTSRGTVTGAEVKLTRQVQVVAIPVFQFGIYSDSDVSFFAGPPFDFGGRTHTNGNLWLAANSGPLYLADKVTVAGQVVRSNLENGTALAGGSYTGVVTIATTPNPAVLPAGPTYGNAQWSPLALTEGSVTSANPINITNVALAAPNGGWPAVETRYNGQLNSGVPILSLTTTALGGLVQPISLIRRPTPGATQAVLNEQYFIEASLRILLDDYPAGVTPGTAGACHNTDMMAEQTVTSGVDPIDLATLALSPGTYGWYTGLSNVPALRIPLPLSGAGGSYLPANGYWIKTGEPTITGCIKIEYQNLGGAWTDITTQILALGFTGRNINPLGPASYVAPPTLPPLTSNVAQGPTTNPNVPAKIGCTDPSPNAIIRIERLRDNPSTGAGGVCGTPTVTGTDYWPMALFDSREGTLRTVTQPSPTQITAQGVMYYIELDAGNLANWFNTSALPLNNNTGGFTVYFSDRRGERTDPNAANTKTGSFGFNDVVNNPGNGCPNNTPDQGEDFEGDGILRTYGGAETIPLYPLASLATNWTVSPLWGGSSMTTVLQASNECPGNGTNWPGVTYVNNQEARENPPVFFRRALKIVNGQSLNLGTTCGAIPCGLTIASENPVYIQGDYNAPANGTWAGASVAAAVAADAITLLSDNWNDVNSFAYPYSIGTAGTRTAVQTAYRTALIAGKSIPFVNPAGEAADFGTDGGVHNFLKFLETWAGINCYYEGSLVSFYYARQAVGTYKNWGAVYSPPNRNYFFDTNFTLGPQYLPPRTPSLRSINTIGFSQELLPTQ
jgi:hypothetical protein